jgi:hypothetical protein
LPGEEQATPVNLFVKKWMRECNLRDLGVPEKDQRDSILEQYKPDAF